MSADAGAGCVDPSRLALAIFGAIFGTLLLCTGFALAIWYLVRNHQLADKLLFLERGSRKRKNDEEKAAPPQCLDEVDDTTADGKEKGEDLAELNVAIEMEKISLHKEGEGENGGLEERGQIEEKTKEEEGEGERRANREEAEEEGGEQMAQMEPSTAPKMANGKGKEDMGTAAKSTARHGVILDPLAIASSKEGPPKKGDALRPLHRKAPSEESLGTGGPSSEMAERLQKMLSAEQFGMLEANRRRLQQERRQLRELGVI